MSECTDGYDVDLSEDGLRAIEQRVAKATLGEWAQDPYSTGGTIDIWACGGAGGPSVAYVPRDRPDDAEFIEHARTDVPALVTEVRRLRERDSAWQRATKCGEPEQVHERMVRLCSCDDAVLPQIGDEVDACWECDGLIKVTESDEPADVSVTDGATP